MHSNTSLIEKITATLNRLKYNNFSNWSYDDSADLFKASRQLVLDPNVTIDDSMLYATALSVADYMLIQKEKSPKAAGPKTLRETALDFVAGVLNGTEDGLNPLRLDAARMVIENYWSFDHEHEDAPKDEVFLTLKPSETKTDPKCPPDAMYAVPEPEHYSSVSNDEVVNLLNNYKYCGYSDWRFFRETDRFEAGLENKMVSIGWVGGIQLGQRLKANGVNPSLVDNALIRDEPNWQQNLAEGIANGQKYAEQQRAKENVEMWNDGAPEQLKVKQPIPNAAADFGPREPGTYPVAGGRQPYHAPALTEIGTELGKYRRFTDNPVEIKPTGAAGLDFAKIAAEGGPVAENNTERSYDRMAQHFKMPPFSELPQALQDWHDGKHLVENAARFQAATCRVCAAICEDTIEGLCPDCSKERRRRFIEASNPPKPEPMTLERAVEVLNERKYRDYCNWVINHDRNRAASFRDMSIAVELMAYEAISVAEKLEREKTPHNPVSAWHCYRHNKDFPSGGNCNGCERMVKEQESK